MAKIVIIGAGSAEFTRNIIADLCSYCDLRTVIERPVEPLARDRNAARGPRQRSKRRTHRRTPGGRCLALNRTFLNVAELTVRAALEERREMCHDLIAGHGDL